MLEVELVPMVTAILKEQYNATCYHEVKPLHWNRCIDMVATTPDNVIAIELKTSFNMTLLFQAYQNRQYCNYTAVAFPHKSLRAYTKKFVLDLCNKMNVLLITVTGTTAQIENIGGISRNDNPLALPLYDEQIDGQTAMAGTHRGGSWTPYKQTVKNIIEYVRNNGNRCNYSTVIKSINHHYCNYAVARNTIKNCVLRGDIKELYFDDNDYICAITP